MFMIEGAMFQLKICNLGEICNPGICLSAVICGCAGPVLNCVG